MYGVIDELLEFLGFSGVELNSMADVFPWLLRVVITFFILGFIYKFFRSAGSGRFFR